MPKFPRIAENGIEVHDIRRNHTGHIRLREDQRRKDMKEVVVRYGRAFACCRPHWCEAKKCKGGHGTRCITTYVPGKVLQVLGFKKLNFGFSNFRLFGFLRLNEDSVRKR